MRHLMTAALALTLTLTPMPVGAQLPSEAPCDNNYRLAMDEASYQESMGNFGYAAYLADQAGRKWNECVTNYQ